MRLTTTVVTDTYVEPIHSDFYQLVDNIQVAARGTVERVKEVARMRNTVMEKALEEYPRTTHVLMVDKYYLGQKPLINKLIRSYDDESMILGASTWITIRRNTIRPITQFYDYGTTPEAKNSRFDDVGRIPVRAVGACYIFPVEAWVRNGYQCDPTRFVPEHVSLCKGYPTFLTYDIKLMRPDRTDQIYPIGKALRVKLGEWRRKHVYPRRL